MNSSLRFPSKIICALSLLVALGAAPQARALSGVADDEAELSDTIPLTSASTEDHVQRAPAIDGPATELPTGEQAELYQTQFLKTVLDAESSASTED